MKNSKEVREDFLSESADDYVGLWSLIRRIKFDMGSKDPATVRGMTMSLLAELLGKGLIGLACRELRASFKNGNSVQKTHFNELRVSGRNSGGNLTSETSFGLPLQKKATIMYE